MRKISYAVFYISLFLTSMSADGQDYNILWEQKISDQPDIIRITHVKNHNGLNYVGGTFKTDVLHFGNHSLYNNSPDGSGLVDFFIAIYDDNGFFQTAFKYSGTGFGYINDLEIYDNSIYILSNLNVKGTSRTYLLKFNNKGNFLDTIVFRPKSNDTYILDALPDDNGNVILYGYSDNTDFYINEEIYTPDSAYKKMRFLLKLNPDMEIDWGRSVPQSFSSAFFTLSKTVSNEYTLSSNNEMLHLDTSGEITYHKKYSIISFFASGIIPTSDGGYYISGNFCSDTFPLPECKIPKMFPGQNAVFIVRFDRDDNPLWVRIIEANDMLFFSSMLVNKNDHIIIKVNHEGKQVFINHEEVLNNMYYKGIDLLYLDQAGIVKYAASCIADDAVYTLDNSNNLLIGSKIPDYTIKEGNIINVFFYWALSRISLGTSDMQQVNMHNVISVFPNPSNQGVFTLNHVSELPINITVYDLEGRIVNKSVISKENRIINLTNYPKGIYILKTEKESGRYEKLIYR